MKPGATRFPGILVLGLAGTYCAGKSSVAKALEAQGAVHIEVDQLGHQALEDQADKVVRAFGPGVQVQPGENGQAAVGPRIDRKALGRLVFGRPEELKKLEAIVHPAMKARVRAMLEDLSARARLSPAVSGLGAASGSPEEPGLPFRGLVVVNAAILFPMGLDEVCDLSVLVDAPFLLRLYRALKRDHLGWVQTWKRLSSQKDLYPKKFRSRTDIDYVRTHTSRAALLRIQAVVNRKRGEDS